ncbi:DMT family transporter [Enterovibrio norvegicus]|uniref:Multidrug DMT transporter permease n=1 Tax=Enterovibrio norvegicus TaxID=188144 RepID=A0A2N7LAK0_9GAMM|nr:DMT family transporter [Enterovibrio norvegicus]PML80203.1 multidrug DMT transporter permease [Enterovibrio norvegicus]PMN91629.1 multidrug DMT transporter permease [Enterovibrio norvegicus]
MNDTSAAAQPNSDYRQGIIFALIGTVLFSLKPILIKLAYAAGGDVTDIMSLRAVSSLPLYLAILIWLCRVPEERSKVRQFGLQAVFVGILGYYFASLLNITALEFISAQLERLLLFLFPSFVVIISWVFLKEPPRQGTFVSIGLGYAGVAMIVLHDFSSFGSQVWIGSAMAVGAALIFAIYLVLSKKVISNIGAQLFTSIGMGSAGVVIMVQHQWQGTQFSNMSDELIVLGVALGFFCTVLPSYFVAAAMARLTPSVLSLTSNVGPAITALFAITLLDEAFTIWHGLGMLLVVYAVVRINKKA